jgi:hypothetical protein
MLKSFWLNAFSVFMVSVLMLVTANRLAAAVFVSAPKSICTGTCDGNNAIQGAGGGWACGSFSCNNPPGQLPGAGNCTGCIVNTDIVPQPSPPVCRCLIAP